MFRVIVCGSRDFSDHDHLYHVMDRLLAKHEDLVVVQGGARGGDALAYDWARLRGVPSEEFTPDWSPKAHKRVKVRADGIEYDPSAGAERNEKMLRSTVEGEPIRGIVAFFRDNAHPSRGTSHMVRIAREAGVPVYIPEMPAYQF